jgi:hypothetical protein
MNKYQVRQLPLTVAIGSVLSVGSLQAATITVDSSNDGVLGTFPTECTLRAAIAAANTDAVVDGCLAGDPGLDLIVFDPSLDQSTITIAAPETPFVITDSVSISGPSAGAYESLFVSGGNQSRVFEITGSSPGSIDVVMDSLSIENGYAGLGFDDGRGGGIVSENANLTLTNARMSANYGYYGYGGIGFSTGTLTLDNAQIRNNSTGYFGTGGGVAVTSGTLSVTGGAISNNSSYYGSAGIRLRLNSTATLTDTVISNNASLGYFPELGAGISSRDSELTITNSAIYNNSLFSGGSGGGISAANSQLTVIGSEIRSNTLGYYFFGGSSGGGLWLSSSTLTMEGSSVTQNSVSSYYAAGAAIAGFASTVDIRNSIISQNVVESYAFIPGGQEGGAFSFTGGSMSVTGSEISANIANGAYQLGAVGRFVDHALSLTNVTLSENQLINADQVGADAGSALQIEGGSTAEFVHVTMDGNTDDTNPRFSVFREPTVILSLVNSILSGPAGADVCNAVADTVTASLATDASCTGTATGPVDLALGPLADNGGPSRTQALDVNSVAIDAGGDCATDLGVLTDQRAAPRDGQCDLGAFEFVDSIFLDRFES